MKKTVSILLLAALLLTAGVRYAPAALAEEPAPSEVLGEVDGTVYTNEFFDLRAEMDDGWFILSDEEIRLIAGISSRMVSDEELAEQLKNSGGLVDFYALNLKSTDENMNIQICDLGTSLAAVLGERAFLELSLEMLKETFTRAGIEDLEITVDVVDFSGEEHASFNIRGLFSGTLLHERMVYVFRDQYAALITVVSADEDRPEEILAFFAPEEEQEDGRGGNYYTDPVSQASFLIPEGWEQASFYLDKQYLDAKFVPVGQNFVSILYGCEDAWEAMSALEKLGRTRADVNNDMISAEEIAEEIGVSADSVTMVTYGDNEYFRAAVFTMEAMMCIRNGYFYMFEFMGALDSEYHAAFEEILASAVFP